MRAMSRRTLRGGLLVIGYLAAVLGMVAGAPAPAAGQASEAEVSIAEAVLAYDAGKYDEALGHLREAVKLDPRNAEAHYYTGLVLLAQKKPGEAIRALETARQIAPADLAVLHQLGLAYFARKEYGKAEGPLEQVFKAAPRTDGVGYYLGYIRYRKGDYKGALETLRAGASADPDIQQLTKVYAGLSLARLGESEAAKTEVDQALRIQGATAATPVADRLRTTVAAKPREDRRFRAEVRTGFLYDTNPAVLPRPSRDPAAEEARELRPVDSVGFLFGINAGYTFFKYGPWEANAGIGFYRIQYADEPHFNTNNFLLSIGGSYRDSLRGMPWLLAAEYSWDDTTVGGDAFLTRHTASAAWTLIENAGNLSALQVRYQDKDFSQIDNDTRLGMAANFPRTPLTAEFRSAVNWLFGIVHLFRFEADKHYIRLGFQYDAEKADGRNYSYDGYRYLVGGQYTLPWYRIRTQYDFDLHQRYYRNKNTILNNDAALFNVCHRCPYTREREDTEQNHTITVELPLPYNTALTLQQFWTAVNSNIDVFSFDRSVTTLSFSWRY
jgi:Flp pilus assembly protein TadD